MPEDLKSLYIVHNEMSPVFSRYLDTLTHLSSTFLFLVDFHSDTFISWKLATSVGFVMQFAIIGLHMERALNCP